MLLSSLAAEHVHRPRHRGPLQSGAYGVSGSPGDGPYVEIWTRAEGGVVREAAFRTPGCPSSTAAASVLCEIATGRAVANVADLTSEDLLCILGGLPEGKERYAAMAVEALRRSLEND